MPGLQQANVNAREALVSALRDALSAIAGRSRDVCLVIPDATTRIMLLDFDTLPAKAEGSGCGGALSPEEIASLRSGALGRIIRSAGNGRPGQAGRGGDAA